MNIPELEEELRKIRNILPKLKPYWQDHLNEIPNSLKQEIKTLKIVPPFTSGGLEPMKSVLNTIYWAEYIVEEEINKRKGIKKPEEKTKKILEFPALEEKKPSSSILDFGPYDQEKPTKGLDKTTN